MLMRQEGNVPGLFLFRAGMQKCCGSDAKLLIHSLLKRYVRESRCIRALAEMDNTSKGDLTSEEYIKKVNDLLSILGADQSRVLATKFLDGIHGPRVQSMVDSQVEERYILSEVLRAFDRPLDVRVTRLNTVEERKQPPPDPTLIMMETMKQHQKV